MAADMQGERAAETARARTENTIWPVEIDTDAVTYSYESVPNAFEHRHAGFIGVVYRALTSPLWRAGYLVTVRPVASNFANIRLC